MKQVALHLQKHAHGITGIDKDSFARSAYNRYYYYCFLATREMLVEFDITNTSKLGHKSYPDFLRGTLHKTLAKELGRAKRNSDKLMMAKLSRAKQACNKLAQQFETANGVRIIADYHPQELVLFQSSTRYSLRQVEISAAHEWAKNTEECIQHIKDAWNNLNA